MTIEEAKEVQRKLHARAEALLAIVATIEDLAQTDEEAEEWILSQLTGE